MKLINNKGEILTMEGESIESFERVEKIKEIVILGEKGGIRRIILK
jgi:hypothetical protein